MNAVLKAPHKFPKYPKCIVYRNIDEAIFATDYIFGRVFVPSSLLPSSSASYPNVCPRSAKSTIREYVHITQIFGHIVETGRRYIPLRAFASTGPVMTSRYTAFKANRFPNLGLETHSPVRSRRFDCCPRSSHGSLNMADMMVLRVLLALLGGTQILRAEPSPSPTVKSAGSSLASVVAGSSKPTRAWDKPYFDDISPRNVTAIVGQKAVLSCHVKHPGNRTVSWMRKRDLHILTSSIITYTGDGRFSVKHPEPSDEWRLTIAFVQPRDAGIYECQVNTEPKMNLAFSLRVEESAPVPATTTKAFRRTFTSAAQAKILNSEDVYVKKGSTISLTCTVNVQSTPPSSVMWHHGGAVVDFDSPRGGVSLETEKTESGTTSKLLVTQARSSDSGNYTCIPSNANPASVMVHVLNGEHPAAMQHGGSCGVTPTILLATLTLLFANLLR